MGAPEGRGILLRPSFCGEKCLTTFGRPTQAAFAEWSFGLFLNCLSEDLGKLSPCQVTSPRDQTSPKGGTGVSPGVERSGTRVRVVLNPESL